mmetsp:Transcript_6999/g.11319  ORF Transcript_6999/g.11319 Transcript_6999/m.11319 type:complete len:204 (-) Transcript_6999:2110-2721(-)
MGRDVLAMLHPVLVVPHRPVDVALQRADLHRHTKRRDQWVRANRHIEAPMVLRAIDVLDTRTGMQGLRHAARPACNRAVVDQMQELFDQSAVFGQLRRTLQQRATCPRALADQAVGCGAVKGEHPGKAFLAVILRNPFQFAMACNDLWMRMAVFLDFYRCPQRQDGDGVARRARAVVGHGGQRLCGGLNVVERLVVRGLLDHM